MEVGDGVMGRGMGHQWELNREEVYPLMYPVLCVSVWDAVTSEHAYSHTGHCIGYLSLLQQNKRLEQFKGKEYFVSQLRVWSLARAAQEAGTCDPGSQKAEIPEC